MELQIYICKDYREYIKAKKAKINLVSINLCLKIKNLSVILALTVTLLVPKALESFSKSSLIFALTSILELI